MDQHARSKHAREWNGRCLDCQQDQRDRLDLPVCSHAEHADDDEPMRGHCAWCGHEVTR